MTISKNSSPDSELASLNSLSVGAAEVEFLKCCGSKNWARGMVAARPFVSVNGVFAEAERVWWALEPADWLEAFHGHPKIGEQKAAANVAVDALKWSAQEQSGVENSADDTMKALAELNRSYEEKFGFIFIVCATGKSSDEMLSILRARFANPVDVELRNAAAEQAKITELRLKKLINNQQP